MQINILDALKRNAFKGDGIDDYLVGSQESCSCIWKKYCKYP